MKIDWLFILLLSILTHGLSYSSVPCACEEILSQSDCSYKTSLNCEWESGKCQPAQNVQGNLNSQDEEYCIQFTSQICQNHNSCLWNNNLCTHFTACSTFNNTTDKECQGISNRCFTDGTQCYERTNCENYQKQAQCQVNKENKQCYWDIKNEKCIMITECSQLNIKNQSDSQEDKKCRDQISICTFNNEKSGCIESGLNCSDQSEPQCYWNRDQSQKCIWNGSKCVDKICENAPLKITTDQECIKYLDTCTTKLNGGCILRTVCSSAQVEEACKTDIGGNRCYWNKIDDFCMEITSCMIASSDITTNEECQSILPYCITTLGGGCVQNGYCSAANTKEACVQDINGNDCFWNNYLNTCDNKICSNAPVKDYNNEDLCQKFLPQCIFNNQTSRCDDKTCNTASESIKSDKDCEQYFPNNNCITKPNGGCMIKTNCKSILLQNSCIKNIYGNDCYWNDLDSICLDKTCSNAPITYTTHEQCFKFKNTCTIQKSGQGCIDWNCNNSISQILCQTNKCIWKNTCQPKYCSLASKLYTTHQQCNEYLNQCTLSNQGYGCITIPLKCEAITIQEACKIKKIIDYINNTINYPENSCGWDGNKCIDFSCITISKIYNTTNDCNLNYKDHYCVSANPINGIVQGCMDLPNTCNARLTQDNCEQSGPSGYPICLWNNNKLHCIEKSCLTANDPGFSNYLSQFSNDNCINYQSNCILNNDKDGCILNPNNCQMLNQNNCNSENQNWKCIWNQNKQKCLDKICINIEGITHEQCQIYGCTVNGSKTGCQSLQSQCSNYQTMEQCQIDTNNYPCKWINSQCRDKTCNDAPNDSLYSSDQQCQRFIVKDHICTVATRIGGRGCQELLTDCIFYTSENQCSRTLNGDRCVWIYQKCYSRGYFESQQCSNLKGTPSECSIKEGCFKDSSASETDPCQLNCNIRTGISLTFQICQQLDQSCTVSQDRMSCANKKYTCQEYTQYECAQSDTSLCTYNTNLNKCLDQLNYCYNYTTEQDCTISTQDGLCIWDYLNGSCQKFKTSDCPTINDIEWNESNCNKYFEGCTSNRERNGCQEQLDNCSQYLNINNCTLNKQGIRCFWKYDRCIQIDTPETQCSLITLTALLFSYCQEFNPKCSVNVYGTNCIYYQDRCDQYSLNDCVQAKEGQCIQFNQNCIKKTCDMASPNFVNDADCFAFMSTCIVARMGGCQTRSNCKSYMSQEQCKFNQEGKKCFWNITLQNCVDLSCQNIEQTYLYDSHDKCFDIDSIIKCTVQVKNGINVQGCTNLTNCNLYTIQEQCHINSNGKECEWITNQSNPSCQDKSCYTAPYTINSDQDCKNYYSGSIPCTVAAFQNLNSDIIIQGCQPINECSKYIVKDQCLISIKGDICVWIDNDKQCKDKSCQTAPETYTTDESCRNYLQNCTVSELGQGCTNVQSQCELYKIEVQCKRDLKEQQCYWTNEGICITKTCDNAPNTITNDIGCNQYLNNCISYTNQCRDKICEDYQYKTDKACRIVMKECTTDGQKCILRGTCIQAQSKYGCITQQDGQQCEWIDINQSDQYCTIKSCQTAPNYYNTEQDCQGYLINCIPKQGGGCILKSICSSVNIQQGCTTALNGTKCNWSNGICRDQNCNDLQGQSHKICNQQRQDCTIGNNGYCNQIQYCSQTKIKAACIEGLDGPCLWVDGTCYKYDSCESIQGQTHEFCQKVSNQCTTDGNKCIGIKLCQDTNVKGCVKGIDGYCYFNQDDKKCSKLECSNLQFQKHSDCQEISQNQCTSNGQTCIDLQGNCQDYKIKISCVIDSNANQCDWTPQGSCQIKNKNSTSKSQDCSLYKNNRNTCNQVMQCVYDGSDCIDKTNCSSYNKVDACNQDGLDGICIWNETNNKCRLMTSCSDGDYQSCIKANNKCTWQGFNQGNKCIEHTCQTYYQETGLCQNVYKWINTTQIICQFLQNICQELDPTTLNRQDCFKVTNYAYTWSSEIQKCIQCQKVQNQQDGTNNSNQSSIQGIQISVITIIFIILLTNI